MQSEKKEERREVFSLRTKAPVNGENVQSRREPLEKGKKRRGLVSFAGRGEEKQMFC